MGIYRDTHARGTIQDPIVITDDDQPDMGSGDYSPLEDVPFNHEEYFRSTMITQVEKTGLQSTSKERKLQLQRKFRLLSTPKMRKFQQ